MKHINNSSIKAKFIIMLVLSSILPIIILGAYSYSTTLKSLESQARTTSLHALDRVSAFIELNLLQINNYASNLSQDSSIVGLLEQKKTNAEKGEDNKRKVEIEMQSESKSITIPVRVFIITEKGDHYENINYDEDKINKGIEKIKSEDWYKNNNKYSDQTKFLGVKPSYIDGFESRFHYYFFHNIRDSEGKFIGIVLLDMNTYIFDRLLSSVVDSNSDIIYMTDDSFNILSSSNETRNGQDETAKKVKEILKGDSSTGNNGEFSKEYIAVTSRLINTNWMLVYLTGRQNFLMHTENILVFMIGLIVILLIIGFLLYLYVNKTITVPIIQLSKAMGKVQKSELDVRFPVVSSDEIGILSKGFNKMLSDIKELIDKVKLEERQLKDLEFSMLQAQINPHFLYNSLNGIKWMAEFMGCDNISQAISWLVKLLQYSIGSSESTITLCKEIEYLNSYIFLNNLRFNNKFCFINNIPDEYSDFRIIKFTIQPLIENSILHGYDGKPGTGNISISLQKENDNIILSVTDDGVGISEEKLDSVLRPTKEDNFENKSAHIGLRNVDRRLKLVYGEKYGIHLNSSVGNWTKVMIVIPDCEVAENHEDIGS